MQAVLSSRHLRLCVLFVGLILLIRTLVAMQTSVENDSHMWTLHILTSSILQSSPQRENNISDAVTAVSSSDKESGVVDRLKVALNTLLDTPPKAAGPRRRSAEDPRLIVDWTTFFGVKLSDRVKRPMSLCPMQCNFSNDLSLADQADAILFHLRDTDPNKLPPVRHPFQRYIFFLMESPMYSGSALGRLSKNFFNWTMTYRLDSDFIQEYDRLILKNATNYLYEKNEYQWEYVVSVAMRKNKTVAQFVSNCNTLSKREKYVEQLAKKIPVDIFGSCGGKMCNPQKDSCTAMLTNNYLFYLAFENSVCLDYVTEKFWRMKLLIVPIVLRASDYANIAPNGSYIAADQFESPAELAAYLNRLANNRTEYLHFFEWTKYYSYSGAASASFCDLCTRLHDDTLPPKSYDNMEAWWTTKGNCQNDFAQKLIAS